MPASGNESSVAAIARSYSPLTLAHEWPQVGRLLFLVAISSLGTTMNGFFVASFFVETSLKKVGNVFLACVGMADMIVTTVIIPTCAVVLLSGQWDTEPVCRAMHFLGVTSTYCFSLFFLLVAAETYYRICRSVEEYAMFVSMNMSILVTSVFVIGFTLGGVGVYMDLDYDYCQRVHFGNFYFRAATSVLFHAVPFILTMLGLILSFVRIRRRARSQIQYKRSRLFERDNSSTALNLTAYIFFVLAWTPYLVIVHEFPGTSDAKFYHSVWLGLFRSVLSSLLYGCLNRNFQRAFAHLFNYCCCKSTLSSSFTVRHRRGIEYKSGTGDVRVHIMHQVVSVNSPARCGSSTRETQEL